MSLRFATLATMSISTLVGLGMLAVRVGTQGRASADEFQPIKEAELPKGFPTYTPVGKIEIKKYPVYRKASASGPAEFWTLFQHIKQNNVTMTAPVEMDYGDPRSLKNIERSMSFMYERSDQGSTGKQGSVEVSDVPATAVVSIGCRGSRTKSAIGEARDKLVNWLDQKNMDYVSDGPMRIMGYNSPFVPRDRNFFEVQIPVKAANTRFSEVEGER